MRHPTSKTCCVLELRVEKRNAGGRLPPPASSNHAVLLSFDRDIDGVFPVTGTDFVVADLLGPSPVRLTSMGIDLRLSGRRPFVLSAKAKLRFLRHRTHLPSCSIVARGRSRDNRSGESWETSQTADNQRDETSTAAIAALGQRIRAMRGFVSLERVANKVGSSKSELSRVERGEKLLSQHLADTLDAYFGTGRGIRLERDAIEQGALPPLLAGQFRSRWLHHFPATYTGPVWSRVLPHPSRTRHRHRLMITWGTWQRAIVLDSVAPSGGFLTYTKGDDGLSVPLFFEVDPPAALTHGLGVANGIDINSGWLQS